MKSKPHSSVLLRATLGVVAVIAAVACAARDGVQQENLSAVSPPLEHLSGTAYEAAERVKLPEVPPEEDPGLHNVYRLSRNIVSGSEPNGEEAFRFLQEMGIKTILSVDGKVPEADLAAKYGIDYVHVPIQYRGIADDEMMRISKTFREKQGPFFVHCFHGKHRGPAAAAVGRVVLDGVPREQAIAEMRQWCGTSPSYEGLYRDVAAGEIPEPRETQQYDWDFPAAHPLPGFRHAMIEVSRADDNLKYLAKHGWQPGPDHPDVDALNEAAKLAGLFERAEHMDDVTGKPADFRAWMAESVVASARLRSAIEDWKGGAGTVAEIDDAYQDLAASCTACHKVYRN